MFTPEQVKLHEEIAKAKSDPKWRAMIADVAERDRKARDLLRLINLGLPSGLTGVVMVNADTHDWFCAENRHQGWTMARQRWGEKICHPPVWMIVLSKDQESYDMPLN